MSNIVASPQSNLSMAHAFNTDLAPFTSLLTSHQREIFEGIVALVEDRLESPLMGDNFED